MPSYPSPMGSSKRRSTWMHHGRRPRHRRCMPPHIDCCAARNDVPLMLADNRDILAAPIPTNDLRKPTRLKLWAKCTRTIVNQSKADATTVIHERLTSYFRYQRTKKTATPPQPSTHPIPSTTAHQTHETDLEMPGPRSNTITHQLHTTFQFVLRHLGAVAKGAVHSIPQRGAESRGVYLK